MNSPNCSHPITEQATALRDDPVFSAYREEGCRHVAFVGNGRSRSTSSTSWVSPGSATEDGGSPLRHVGRESGGLVEHLLHLRRLHQEPH
ncbi:hypothetical protein HPB47_022324 [Ixodes persulcatus]|uniref:Uncharacterized protein n=1 Tax=Ixodes persulcatus TaxID=34615 RepID=A0AC60QAU3_IXOPE|nr:hypothetical protein HPB47_022324 [Ixodes persulcatus]